MIHPSDQEKTTFTCPYETFAYRQIPFGLCNALPLFKDARWKYLMIFLGHYGSLYGHLSMCGSSFDVCLVNLEKVLERRVKVNLVLNREKCHFMVKEGIILRHSVSAKGIEVDRAKV